MWSFLLLGFPVISFLKIVAESHHVLPPVHSEYYTLKQYYQELIIEGGRVSNAE